MTEYDNTRALQQEPTSPPNKQAMVEAINRVAIATETPQVKRIRVSPGLYAALRLHASEMEPRPMTANDGAFYGALGTPIMIDDELEGFQWETDIYRRGEEGYVPRAIN